MICNYFVIIVQYTGTVKDVSSLYEAGADYNSKHRVRCTKR